MFSWSLFSVSDSIVEKHQQLWKKLLLLNVSSVVQHCLASLFIVRLKLCHLDIFHTMHTDHLLDFTPTSTTSRGSMRSVCFVRAPLWSSLRAYTWLSAPPQAKRKRLLSSSCHLINVDLQLFQFNMAWWWDYHLIFNYKVQSSRYTFFRNSKQEILCYLLDLQDVLTKLFLMPESSVLIKSTVEALHVKTRLLSIHTMM